MASEPGPSPPSMFTACQPAKISQLNIEGNVVRVVDKNGQNILGVVSNNHIVTQIDGARYTALKFAKLANAQHNTTEHAARAIEVELADGEFVSLFEYATGLELGQGPGINEIKQLLHAQQVHSFSDLSSMHATFHGGPRGGYAFRVCRYRHCYVTGTLK